MKAEDFVAEEEVEDSLAWGKAHAQDHALIDSILAKAAKVKGLTHREAAALLFVEDEDELRRIKELAMKIKQEIYGNRIVLFAPLYLSNYCVNGCVYCPYHGENGHIRRKKLTQDEIRKEVIALQDMGHKRLALEAGEDDVRNPIDYILDSIHTIYSIHHKNGAIRRVNVNIAATTVENYKKLHEAGIGTYILFQETYNKKAYERMHPHGPKSNWAYHTEAMDRAQQGGIDDVGVGALFGLYDWRYDFVALLMHAEHLEAVFGVGPHTVSVPRVRRADGIDPKAFPYAVDDRNFERIVAVLRITVPYTGMIISTRESKKIREAALSLGVSQISGASSTSVGGYSEKESEEDDSRQFEVSDNRTLDQVIHWLLDLGYVPSFCTACYREGRTGDRFMRLAKTGEIKNCCHPNALLTMKEYLEDYASASTKSLGERVIRQELPKIPRPAVRQKAEHLLQDLAAGGRDFRF